MPPLHLLLLPQIVPKLHPLVIDIDAFLKESLSSKEQMTELYRLLLDDPGNPSPLAEGAPPLGRATEPKIHKFRFLT